MLRLTFHSHNRLSCAVKRTFCIKVPPKASASGDAVHAHDKEAPPVPPPEHPSHDWIGPADKKSNLRRVILAHRENETEAERSYRELREATNEWNHKFWAQQNEFFIKAKEDFVRDRLIQKKSDFENLAQNEDTINSGVKQVLSAEEMAEFYQEFLRHHRETFRIYNRQWYRKNFSLLWPAMRANVHRFLSRNKR